MGLYFPLNEEIVLFLALLTLIGQGYYYIAIYGRLAFGQQATPLPETPAEPVSIIICARNEYAALQQNLKQVLEQDYAEFEVIVVNDCSEDESETLLASMQMEYPRLIFRTIVKDEIFKHSKKMALGVGIKAARYDLLLFIDADCYPSGNQWLRSMQSRFTAKTAVTLGYTRLINNNVWIRADRFMQALHYLGKALRGRPYMGIGSNLAYRKQSFFDNKGFDVRITENLREDRIFINKVARPGNTAVVLSPAAATVSTLHINFERWRRERHEEIRSFALCDNGSRYPQLMEVLIRLLFFAAMATAFIQHAGDYLITGILASVILLRLALQLIVFIRTERRMGEKGLAFPLMLWDLVFPFVYLLLIFSSHLPRRKSGQRGLWN